MCTETSESSQFKYEREILKVLLDDISDRNHANFERKLKRRLRAKRLGPFDVDRVETLRILRRETVLEIDKGRDSSFYNGLSGRTAKLEDWDTHGLCHHLGQRYPEVSIDTLQWFVGWAIYWNYLR